MMIKVQDDNEHTVKPEVTHQGIVSIPTTHVVDVSSETPYV